MAQSSFFCAKLELAQGSSEQVIEPLDFDRSVLFIRGAGETILFGFDEFVPSSGGGFKDFAVWTPSSESDMMQFLLPSGKGLWMGMPSGEVRTISFMVTA